MRIVTAPGGPVMTNTYVLADDAGTALVIDPGYAPDELDADLKKRGWHVAAIVATHGHFDHVAGIRRAKELWDAPVWMHPDTVDVATHCAEHARWFGVVCPDCPPPDHTFAQGDTFTVGELSFEVRDVSGHCPGSVALFTPGHVFTGDALFAGSIGRVDLPHSDAWQLMANLREQLMTLPDDTIVYPGHGETTTIGQERHHNPFRAEWEKRL